MGIAERKQRQMDAVRNTILDQSWQIVQEEGWQALSIRKIADAIEYSTPVIYRHFDSKDTIISEFTKKGYGMLAEKLQNTKKGRTDPKAQLIAISKAYWEFAFTHQKYYQVMFGLGIPTCETIHSSTEAKAVSDAMLCSISQAIDTEANSRSDKFLKLRTMWSILHGLVAIELLSGDPNPDKSLPILEDAINGFVQSL